MTKKSKIVGDELILVAKAIRRGEKLERTLTKLIAFGEVQPHVVSLLKAVQKGLAHLRTDETSFKENSKNRAKQAKSDREQKSNNETPVAVVVKRVRKKTNAGTTASTGSERT